MDNLDNVPSSEVTSETVSFLYGKLAADKHAFETMESIDIVKSVFGIEAMNPSNVDIVEAIVKNMSHDDQIAIRSRISDRSVVGEMWNFTTPRLFMIKLSKEPLGNGSSEFTLTLVTKYADGDGTEIYVRPLVTFGQGTVRFQSPRLKRIEFGASSVEWLQKIHDDAVAKLEQKLVQEEPKQEPVVEPPAAAPVEAATSETILNDLLGSEPAPKQEQNEQLPPPPEEIPIDNDPPPPPEHKPPLIRAGETIYFSLNKDDKTEVIIQTPDLSKENMRFTDADFCRVYKTGLYRTKCDIFEEDFKTYEQLHELMDKFDIVVEPTEPIPQAKETPTMSQTESQDATAVIIPIIELEFDEGCTFDDEYRATLVKAANDAIRGCTCEVITDKLVTDGLREIVENDNITLKFVSKTEEGVFKFTVTEEKPTEEAPSVDINNVEVQTNLLRGIFGVSDPAITHVQKFLKNHLTEEGNAGFLTTGTFPTETTIVYTEKPYDVTICIVKHMDGAFYRIQLARTNLGLKDHGYIATKDVPGRWVKIGRDIQDVNRRSSGYSFRPRR